MRKKLIDLLIAAQDLITLSRKADFLIASDVVPVVRCKDCKWYRIAPIDNVPYCCHESGYCGEHMKGLFFCAYGERKDNDQK